MNSSNSNGRKGISIYRFKICLDTLSIVKDDNNAIAVGKAVNVLIKVIHVIEENANKVKIAPQKIKQPSLEVLKYINGVKYPEAEVGKHAYAVIEG